MPIISTPNELLDSEVHVDLRPTLGINVHLKCEGFNFAGSAKVKAAVSMVTAAEQQGRINPGSVLIESSSGNLGVALSMVAAAKSLRFVCVTDPKCNPTSIKLIRAFGGEVRMVNRQGSDGSYLGARKDMVRRLCTENSHYVWLNQYENAANWLAHYETTAPVIAKQFPELDVLFVGAGTGGTLTGCARYFQENRAEVRIVAVDSEGSVNFGHPSGPRHIPGLGASEPMPLIDARLVDEVIRVGEPETIRTCRLLARHGMLFGGSTGTVVSGAIRWLGRHDPDKALCTVAIAPDFGDRYIDTVYDDGWVSDRYGETCAPHGAQREW